MTLRQQGDVLIKSTNSIPIMAKKLTHLTLAKGEHTGNHHTITKGDAELYEENGILYLRVNSAEATLTHQEHRPVVIVKGEYEIGRVREYDHLTDEVKNVSD